MNASSENAIRVALAQDAAVGELQARLDKGYELLNRTPPEHPQHVRWETAWLNLLYEYEQVCDAILAAQGHKNTAAGPEQPALLPEPEPTRTSAQFQAGPERRPRGKSRPT